MKMLIIYTHPNHRSLSYAFLQEVILGSEEKSYRRDKGIGFI